MKIMVIPRESLFLGVKREVEIDGNYFMEIISEVDN